MTDRKYTWILDDGTELIASEAAFRQIFEDRGLITEAELFGRRLKVGSNALRLAASQIQYEE